MNFDKKYIFLVGVPGSRWGRLEAMIYKSAPGYIDVSCKAPYLQDMPNHGTQHIYTFWGPFHQHGEGFDRLDLLGPERVMGEIESAYNPNDPGKVRIIRCHWFSYQLDWIAENMPWVDILFVLREPEMCFRWWKESGGWDISYPCYKWYSNDEVLKRQILQETRLMHKFINERRLKITDNLQKPREWIKNNMPEVLEHINTDITVNTLDQTLWPVIYRGTQ
jgi:hypothetical protein